MAAGQFAPQAADSVNAVMCLSEFHEKEVRRETQGAGKFVRVANGILEEDFEGFDVSPNGNELWTASPRGKIAIVDTVGKKLAQSWPGY